MRLTIRLTIVAVLFLSLFTLLAPALRPSNAEAGALADLREGEDPFNVIYQATIDQGKASALSATSLPRTAYTSAPFARDKQERSEATRPVSKLHPLLDEWLSDRAADESVQVLVNLKDDLRLPRFPEPDQTQPRDSKTNQQVLARNQQLIQQLSDQRSASQDSLLNSFAADYKATTVERFWLVNAVLVEMPLGSIQALAQNEQVVYIEPRFTGATPPDGNPINDVDDGRARIHSDPYFNLNQTSGWIGLLDTGVRESHTLFSAPDRLALLYDCTVAPCTTSTTVGNPDDDCWDHGTATAAIITANGNLGVAYRGVSGLILDSFKVYPTGCGGLDGAAVVRGFQQAIAVSDRVIVAEMQAGGDENSTISTAGDNAFDAGAVIIAANGNNGPGAGTVNSPANAHRVIGVGALDVQTLSQQGYQSLGPATDNRFKPDIQAPTNTETASSSSSSALQLFTGTSGATPYASGAAALLRNWLRGNTGTIDPGQVYAQMILSGQQSYPFNNTSGAGLLNLPVGGTAWWGKVSVSNGQTIDIPLTIGATFATADGALWWPEGATETHDDIDVSLINPSGSIVASSVSIPSVFERARATGSLPAGNWTLRIRGYNVQSGPQTVYWAAHLH